MIARGKTEQTKIDKFTSATFTPIAQTTVKAPGPGFLQIVGSVSAKDDGTTGDAKLQYRLSAGNTPLTATPEAFELFLADTPADARDNCRSTA